jgi:hypothetical protein
VKKTLLIAATLITGALGLSSSAAQVPSPILQSLPAEVQKEIEEVRANCREYLKNMDDDRTTVPSGDDGLVQFTLSGAPAVMVDNFRLCGGCYKGANCATLGTYYMAIYVRSGRTWKKAHDDAVRSADIFLSADWEQDPPAFRAMVLGIPGDSKNCPRPRRNMFMRTYGILAWKRPCDVIVRWNGTRFTYEAL